MTDVVGNPEEERSADYYHEPWAQEAVFRYFYGKVGISVVRLNSPKKSQNALASEWRSAIS